MKMNTSRPKLVRKPCSGDRTTHPPGQTFTMKQRGATSIEYVLLAALIGLAAVIALRQTGSGLTSGYENLHTKVQQA